MTFRHQPMFVTVGYTSAAPQPSSPVKLYSHLGQEKTISGRVNVYDVTQQAEKN
ncbi:hypothetical protein LTR78_011003, partial [Recurvomyces mirabilis]